MFAIEARQLVERLREFDAGGLSPMLNVGSGDLRFRTQTQPWIDEILFQDLRSRSIDVIHVDLNEGDGIDVAADPADPLEVDRMRTLLRPKSILCTNVLEHVADLYGYCAALANILDSGGYLIVTVPRSYPHHSVPIDTMFRPTPQEIAGLFPDFEPVLLAIDETESYWYSVRERPWIIFRQIVRAPFPFLGFTRWKRSMHKVYWLFRRYQQSMFIGVKK
jgi:hypothetical protein